MNETFPLFSWYTVETDVTRYKNTGTHVVYDVGGPADGTLTTCGGTVSGTGYPPCGNSTIGKNLANTAEVISVPTNLRIPGAVYCAGADCTGIRIGKQILRTMNDSLQIQQRSLHPALPRLQRRGWIGSKWETDPARIASSGTAA